MNVQTFFGMLNKPMLRLKLAHKLIISSAVFVLPIAVLLAFMIAGFDREIGGAEKEIAGTRVLAPLVDLMQAVPEHQRIARATLDGNTPDYTAVDRNEAAVLRAFDELARQSAASPGITPAAGDGTGVGAASSAPSPAALLAEWRDLAAGWRRMSRDESDERHRRLAQSLLALIRHIGNSAALILDPDLDSYYLMDVALRVMPDAQLRMHRNLADCLDAERAAADTTANRIRLASLARSVRDHNIDELARETSSAIAFDSAYYGVSPTLQSDLPPAEHAYLQQMNRFMESLAGLQNAREFASSLRTTIEQGQGAIEAGSVLWHTSLEQLTVLLHMRIDHFVNARLTAVLLSLAALLVACLLVFFIGRGVTVPLGRITSIATHIAHGDIRRADLELELCAGDDSAELARVGDANAGSEIALLFVAVCTMTRSLHTLVQQVQDSTQLVLTSTTGIASAAMSLEATVVQQAASSKEVNATTREIASTAHSLAETMGRVTEMGSEAAGYATTGGQSLGEIRGIVGALIEAITIIRDRLALIDQRASAINDVIVAITRVSNQTNLLSLNAAIEAEKAGEYGAGFSIVAREIRRLADQTAIAALDIETMISEMQVAVRDGVEGVTSYSDQALAGSTKIAAISNDLEHIIRSITLLGPEFQTVNRGTQMQSHSAGQITEAIEQLSVSTAHTKDSLLGFRGITTQLNEAVQGLQREISRFTIAERGSAAAPRQDAPRP